MTLTQTAAALLHHQPAIAAVLVVLALLIIYLVIWIMLPRRADRADDIERQIATLRQSADHSVATRPRLRAGTPAGWHSNPPPTYKRPPPPPAPPALKPCGGGFCRHRADCADHYCPGRMAAGLSGAAPSRKP